MSARMPDIAKVTFYEGVGREVYRRRIALGMTLAQLAAATESSGTFAHRIENGEQHAPFRFLVLAAKAFGCSVNDFVPAG